MFTSYSFVDQIDANEHWDVAMIPGGVKYKAKNEQATMTIERLIGGDIDLQAECGGTIPKDTCVTHSGSVALVEKP